MNPYRSKNMSSIHWKPAKNTAGIFTFFAAQKWRLPVIAFLSAAIAAAMYVTEATLGYLRRRIAYAHVAIQAMYRGTGAYDWKPDCLRGGV